MEGKQTMEQWPPIPSKGVTPNTNGTVIGSSKEERMQGESSMNKQPEDRDGESSTRV
ncbi:hypothetical protein R3W88_025273 [Solanum pinnatisectum]|uniref:Uncharacterized protein n=1 Tax=Solanum pinnatisectum TaxID=50273 RepID=A0AAV9M5P9_9SOLN|nr:hypothetical protein R3W88_025273 [Solanum pinnatisectum]